MGMMFQSGLALMCLFVCAGCLEAAPARGHRVESKSAFTNETKPKVEWGVRRTVSPDDPMFRGMPTLIVENLTCYNVLISGYLSPVNGCQSTAQTFMHYKFKQKKKTVYKKSRYLLFGKKGSSLNLSFERNGNILFRKKITFNGKTGEDKFKGVAVTRRWVTGEGWMLIIK